MNSLAAELRKKKNQSTDEINLDNKDDIPKNPKKSTKKDKLKVELDLENIPPRPLLKYHHMNKNDLKEDIKKLLEDNLDKIPIDWLRAEYINFKMISR